MKCSVFGCPNSSEQGYLLHKYPRDNARKLQWYTNIKGKANSTNQSQNNDDISVPCNVVESRVCEVHFTKDSYTKNGKLLKMEAVPTIHLGQNEEGNSSNNSDFILRIEDENLSDNLYLVTPKTEVMEESEILPGLDNYGAEPISSVFVIKNENSSNNINIKNEIFIKEENIDSEMETDVLSDRNLLSNPEVKVNEENIISTDLITSGTESDFMLKRKIKEENRKTGKYLALLNGTVEGRELKIESHYREAIQNGVLDSDEELLLFVLLKRRLRRRKRRFWQDPITCNRLELGQFNLLLGDLEKNSEKCFDYLRMSMTSFKELLSILQNKIKRQDTIMRKSISAEERLAITLRYLGTGCSFGEIRSTFKCGKSTARKIVRDVCNSVWMHLKDMCLPTLSEDDWLRISEEFNNRTNFPNCLGAVDEKQIMLMQPSQSGNNKDSFSIDLLASCDSNYRFTFIDVRSHENNLNSNMHKNSELFKKIEENSFNIPENKLIPGNDESLPFTFVGNKVFGFRKHMQLPFEGKNLTPKKKMYNCRLSLAKRYIDCSFGILTSKWQIFQRRIDVEVDFAKSIVKACCLLHNFVRERDGADFDRKMTVIELEESKKQLK